MIVCDMIYTMNREDTDSFYLKNVLTLAYLGDSVFTLMVREHLVRKYDFKPNTLNKKANSVVCARTQAEFMNELKPMLNDNERDIVMRARNAHLNNVAKNSTLAEYSLATQFEALIGYWFLRKETDKLNNMFTKLVEVKL